MKYLFYFVHPAKYHLLKKSINKLKADGHQVDVIIITKDILEELVKSEGWEYTNLFPEGRKSRHLHIYVNAIFNSFRTILRLRKYLRNRKYGLFVTDDFLAIFGKIKKTPVLFLADNDLSTIPESIILLKCADYILAPSVTDLGSLSFKKIGYNGYKALAHLHPDSFTPDMSKLPEMLKTPVVYFFIRCVSVTSTHDIGRKGLNDELLLKLTDFLLPYGKIIISSERILPQKLEQYQLIINKNEVAHYIAFSKIFIGDSTTMCAEAAVLGVPSVEINNWHSKFAQYKELNGKYGLVHGFNPDAEEEIFDFLRDLLANKNLNEEYRKKRKLLLEDTIDVAAFINCILSGYPSSIEDYFKIKDI